MLLVGKITRTFDKTDQMASHQLTLLNGAEKRLSGSQVLCSYNWAIVCTEIRCTNTQRFPVSQVSNTDGKGMLTCE